MSFITQYLLHSPWWVGVVGAVVGLAPFYSAHKRQDKTLQRVSLVIFAVAVILGVLGQMFPTDLEKMEKRSKDIVKAIDAKDWTKLESLMDDATAAGTENKILAQGNKEVANLAKKYSEQCTIAPTSVEGKQTDSLITISMDAVSVQEQTMGRPVPSSWQFDYQQLGDKWILEKITLLRVGQHQTGDQILKEFHP